MAELNVSRQNISKLFSESQGKKFIIPDYQRPYKWTQEKCETLWEDITGFHESERTDSMEYFLGTIVSFEQDEGDIEIIDGQQRITSFFLLLRAFYKKLENMVEDDQVKGLKNQIAPCIWDIDELSQKIKDKGVFHLESLVATDENKQHLHDILESGDAPDKNTDLYSANYRFFLKKCEEYAAKNPMQWKQLCVTILKKCIVLPIECDTSDTALTIFSTLNDRGMPLSDSDIFKAKIYKFKQTQLEKTNFTSAWKDLTEICKNAEISLDDVFRYYTHVLRGASNDKSKEIGLRKFYSENRYEKLNEVNLIDNVTRIANFWLYVNKGSKPQDLDFDLSFESRKYLHCLRWYPNDFWKYLTTVFFHNNYSNQNFDSDLSDFLKSLTCFLFVKFIEKPTVNAIKDDIYTRCIAVANNTDLNLKLSIDEDRLKERISEFSSSRLTRGLLLLHAYLHQNQTALIPEVHDIEHIFPKKWQDTNYNGWSIDDAWEYLEKFGNKIVLEKKINIQAGNGYFGNKQTRYSTSKIAVIQDLANYPNADWVQEDIENRENQFKTDLIEFFMKTIGSVNVK